MTKPESRRGPAGLTLHSPVFYDLFAWVVLLGREQALRERLVRLARLQPGETVLDVGCGTGSLALAAAAVAAHLLLFHVGLRTLSFGALAVVGGVVLLGHRPLIGAVLRLVRGRPKA